MPPCVRAKPARPRKRPPSRHDRSRGSRRNSPNCAGGARSAAARLGPAGREMAGCILDELKAIQAFGECDGDRAVPRQEVFALRAAALPASVPYILECCRDLLVFRRACDPNDSKEKLSPDDPGSWDIIPSPPDRVRDKSLWLLCYSVESRNSPQIARPSHRKSVRIRAQTRGSSQAPPIISHPTDLVTEPVWQSTSMKRACRSCSGDPQSA